MLFGTEAFEIEILKFIQHYCNNEFMDRYMLGISSFGNVGFFWILIAIPLLFTDKYRRTAILMLVGMFAGFLVGNVILKPLIARPRPCWIEVSHQLILPNPTDFSCPSGHALSSFISAFMLSRKNKKVGYVAFTLAAVMAFSRLYLFVHYPTDILIAILLAYAIYKVVIFIYRKYLKYSYKHGHHRHGHGHGHSRSRSHSRGHSHSH